MKKFVEEHSVIFSLIIWRLGLFAIAFLAVIYIPKFGNSFPYWNEELVTTQMPEWVWGFGNFDGVHYLRIARGGYFAQYSQAFFPLYPILIKTFSFLDLLGFSKSLSFFYSGITISTLSFFTAIYFLHRLFSLDYERKVASRAILMLIFFPTAFYFGSIYTESLFLLFLVLTIYFLRKKMFLLSGILASLASATKLIGVLLIVPILVELWLEYKNRNYRLDKKFMEMIGGLIVAPLGFLGYVFYLGKNFNDPLYFLTSQPVFGASRSDHPFILLPQVFYRYIKILIAVPFNSYQFFSSVLELVFTIAALGLLIFSFKKIRFSYWIFSVLTFIVPTLTGTLSSMPRYIIMCFLMLPILAQKNRFFKLLLPLFIIAQVILTCLFVRGYWVS